MPAPPVPFNSAVVVGTWILAGMMSGWPPSGVVVRSPEGSVIPGSRRGSSPVRGPSPSISGKGTKKSRVSESVHHHHHHTCAP